MTDLALLLQRAARENHELRCEIRRLEAEKRLLQTKVDLHHAIHSEVARVILAPDPPLEPVGAEVIQFPKGAA